MPRPKASKPITISPMHSSGQKLKHTDKFVRRNGSHWEVLENEGPNKRKWVRVPMLHEGFPGDPQTIGTPFTRPQRKNGREKA